MSDLPLAGRRILVTRAAHQAGKLSEALRAVGAEPVEVPVLEIGPPESYDGLDNALRHFSNYDWLILTSVNTVRSLVDRAAALGISIAAPASLNVAAVGPATAAAARDAGFPVVLVPESYVAESLVSGLLSSTHVLKRHDFRRPKTTDMEERDLACEGPFVGQRILLARAAIARDIIPDALRQAGARVDVVDAYRNVVPTRAPDKLCTALAAKLDAVSFTSSSSVTHLAEAAEKAGVAFPFAGVPAISIGPVTSQTLREHNWAPSAEASPSDIPGLVDAAVYFFSKK